jgi:hypothetical protein
MRQETTKSVQVFVKLANSNQNELTLFSGTRRISPDMDDQDDYPFAANV